MARLKKISITPGVTWVEAAEVGLNVLCGCPADVVKHLMRRGLIVDTERDGVTFETGPNAILLSDVMVQNGAFCNLAEFPVLQMLYRQGMLIPKHPNNSGAKPLLIGTGPQLEAQMGYIHRGNYGLVSSAEIVAAGASIELAAELMAMKLRFAFGRISHPSELLDTIELGTEPVHVRGGVTLRRRALNLFEFELGGEQVTVDLNLPEGGTYMPAYPLGVHQVDREYFSVIHTGEGDGWDSNRPGMASIVVFQGRIYLIDAGPNLSHTLNALGIGINEVEGLFHTHCHDDHFAGLTTLLRAGHRLKYFATALVRTSVMKKLAALIGDSEQTFADYFDIRDLTLDHWNEVDGLQVLPVLSPHPVETNILYFRAPWDGGYRSYAHLADIVSLDVFAGMVETDDGKRGVSSEFHSKVLADYAMPADVKKLDIGGGMIHGAARDFAEDRSGKLVLAHTSRVLTASEKEIGSGAPFGTVDVIIPGNRNWVWRHAYRSLRDYFPETPHYELAILLNNPIVIYNPETILQRERQQVPHVHLLISGTVEVLEAGSPLNGVLSGGAVIGEMAGIEGRASRKTYRAVSYVQALKVPSGLYREFVHRNGLITEITTIEERRNFLRGSRLCAEALAETTLNRLAKGLALYGFTAGDSIRPHGMLALVKSGNVELSMDDDAIESLHAGDFFGEEEALLEMKQLFHARATTDVELYLVAPDLFANVPVMRWKLLELHRRRMSLGEMNANPDDGGPILWREEYSVKVDRVDHQHRSLLVRANRVLGAIGQARPPDDVYLAFGELIDYARFHFREEEALMDQHALSDFADHRAEHGQLIEALRELRLRYQKGQAGNGEDLAATLRDWLFGHVQGADLKAARELIGKGVA